MIVKFLRPSTTFKGVGYSFTKMLLGKGELMEVKNFHALQSLSNPRTEDYVNYLEALTRQSKRIVYPQLHVTISTKGREHTKQELTNMAGKWLQGMGYGEQPYLIIYHKDTANNHVHLVSTRIGRDGKKIKDSYEQLRGYEVMEKIMIKDRAENTGNDISQALAYQFATRAQFMMLLEIKGYNLKLHGEKYEVFKFGTRQKEISLAQIDDRIRQYEPQKDRLNQLRQIIAKYRHQTDPAIYPQKEKLPGGGDGKITGYASGLADTLHQRFGVQILFHFKDEKLPYGYTVIDHSKKSVYKGGDLMPLAEFIKPNEDLSAKITVDQRPEMESINTGETAEIFSSEFTGLDSLDYPGDFAPIDATLSTNHLIPPLRIDIADDIDDEQINGRNRKRKRKARTNTR